MALGPEDVVRRTFRSARFGRGYNEEDVDGFVQEVVDELRRLRTKIDELEAARVRPLSLQQLDEEHESERVTREREQLELVRQERRELVGELASLQSRLERATSEISSADARVAAAEKAADEAEARRAGAAQAETDTARRLQQLTHDHDVLRGAHEALVQDLRTVRMAAEERATKALGSAEATRIVTAEGEDDLAIISALAHRLHGHHIDVGLLEGERLVAQAEEQARRLRADAETALSEATESARQTLAKAQQEASQAQKTAESERASVVRTARDEHDRLLESAQTEHDRLLAEAEEQRAGILADLQARRELLERRVADLDRQQGDYRDRLRVLVQQQLTSLDDDSWRDGVATGAGSGVNGQR